MSDHKVEATFHPEDRYGAEPETTMAEEPIEDRLRRAWLNGFREGVERSGRGIRWDHS